MPRRKLPDLWFLTHHATEIGERVKARRMELGLTQAELAAAMGYAEGRVNGSSICCLEKGLRGVGVEGMVRIARAMRVSLDWLVTGQGKATKRWK